VMAKTSQSTAKLLAIQAALALDTRQRGGLSELCMRCLMLLGQETSLGRSICHCTAFSGRQAVSSFSTSRMGTYKPLAAYAVVRMVNRGLDSGLMR
jgi:hypothetical protein